MGSITCFSLFFYIFAYKYKLNNILSMGNKRELKRSINYICSELFAECVAVSLNNAAAEQSAVDAVLTCIIKTNSEYIKRISHPEPGMECKKYYKILASDFNKQVDEIIDQIQAL